MFLNLISNILLASSRYKKCLNLVFAYEESKTILVRRTNYSDNKTHEPISGNQLHETQKTAYG